MFVLIADEPGRLLPTIRSRAQPLRVGPVSKAGLRDWLVEHERQAPDQAEEVARLAGGLTGRAIGYTRAPTCSRGARRRSASCWISSRRASVRFDSVRHLLDDAAKLGSPPVEDTDPPDDEAPRIAGAVQRAAALLVIGAWRDLARDLLMVAAGRPQLVAAVSQGGKVQQAALAIDRRELVAFMVLPGASPTDCARTPHAPGPGGRHAGVAEDRRPAAAT